MGKRPGLIYEAIQRLNQLMAPGEKRSEAKAQARARGETFWSFSDGKMHAYQTRETYQALIMRFLHWCRDVHGLKRLAEVDARADELVISYLSERKAQGYSPWTLTTERSAFRLFFGSGTLAKQLELPPRHREAIHRSRHPNNPNRHVQPLHWETLLAFLDATGLRRSEVRDLLVRDVLDDEEQVYIRVRRGKGGKERWVPVLPGREKHVLQLIKGRSPCEHIFARLPKHLNIHAHRRRYAQAYYQHLSGRPLPPASGRLPQGVVDHDAVLAVSRALGHNREDVVLTYYLR
ncbi:hypothetical protein KSD_47760 [Ktedonobacter sp. SOSP1-85]|uniref:tyrosine-type recombinase/integrase n=1 Tax=Ktedonobacter sp. SOSP1-85 TaxID=2778367 RepID=UPI001916AD6B|nr:tyrosine-type recombinase/integrase [Ktedonobacter sp. SOSP1-85]GHO77005.1 hypothetical protein KSD_47760 [Ktedonobacter sp. SOSP1-85]